MNDIMFVYGTCRFDNQSRDGGCTPPLAITTAPGCEVNLPVFEKQVNGSFKSKSAADPELKTVRGARALQDEGGSELQLFTGNSTVTIGASTPTLAKKTVGALRQVPEGLSVPLNKSALGTGLPELRAAETEQKASQAEPAPGQDLPKASDGILSGSLSCSD